MAGGAWRWWCWSMLPGAMTVAIHHSLRRCLSRASVFSRPATVVVVILSASAGDKCAVHQTGAVQLRLPGPARVFMAARRVLVASRTSSATAALHLQAAPRLRGDGLVMLHRTLRASHLSHGHAALRRPSRSAPRRLLPLQHTLAARLTTSTPLFAPAPAATMANAHDQQWAAAKVRQTFLDYFQERGHTFGRHPPCVHAREPH